ncbi:MAG: type II toxin-antitoxin system HicB family antitoxin [Desulfobacterales bacterium]
MKYKEYIGSVHFDAEDRIFHGRVLGITDIIGFEGESVSELEQDFRNAVDDYLETCSEIEKKPEKPFSGKVTLEIPPDLLTSISIEAGRKEYGNRNMDCGHMQSSN